MKLKQKQRKPGKQAGKKTRPAKDTTACPDQLSKTLANGKGPPGDRGACEKESAVQGSE